MAAGVGPARIAEPQDLATGMKTLPAFSPAASRPEGVDLSSVDRSSLGSGALTGTLGGVMAGIPQYVSKRVTRTRAQTYAASPAVVFPLHGFREEKAWAVGWEPEVIFAAGGAPAEGDVFLIRRGGPEEVWVLTTWDPPAGRAGYIHVTAGRDVTEIRIRVSGPVHGPSRVEVSYTWTGLSEAGNAFVEEQTEESFRRSMIEWEEEMAHYLGTGTKLERGRRSPARG